MDRADAWWCCNCELVVSLDVHARCSQCGSDAVDITVRPPVSAQGLASAYLTVDDLERMMEGSEQD